MSTIFKAEDLQNRNQPVAVKVPLPIFSSGVGSWSIFQREEEIGRKLDHPCILKFLPLPVNKRRTYVVTEYVAGRTLAERLRAEGPLPEAEALRIAGQICAGVEHMHERGFVHYDLKPANVILCPDGGLRVLDLGLAHDAVAGGFAFGGPSPAIGSSDYVAPEQIRRKRGRKTADIYGVGAVIYEMLTGQPPFPGDDPFVVASARTLGDPPAPRAVNPRISRQAEEIALRALQRDPAQRYPSIAAMKAALASPELVAITGLCERLQPVTRARRAWRIARYVTVVAVVPLAAQVVLFVLLWRHFLRHPSRLTP